MTFRDTGLWRDVERIPSALRTTLDRRDGVEDVAAILAGAGRVVATGNGASSYVAQALWLAAHSRGTPAEAVVIPAGLLLTRSFAHREGDVVLAFSSSGELRDLVERRVDGEPPLALVTARPTSTLAKAAAATALVHVESEEAVTHTQAFCGAVAIALAVWALATGDDGLAELVGSAPAVAARAIVGAESWAGRIPLPATAAAGIAFGTGPAWAAALEAALLLKEVARIPCEGVETREAATTAMTGIVPGQLALSLPTRGDGSLLAESEEVCAGLGAEVLRVPGGETVDPRLSAIATFPAAAALAGELALRAGLDPDRPAWADAYYATARTGGSVL